MNHGGGSRATGARRCTASTRQRSSPSSPSASTRQARVGWQLDNELSHYEKQYSYSPAATLRFRDWLAREIRQHRPAEHDWGTAFWSWCTRISTRSRFPTNWSIRLPNPHAQLDFARCSPKEAAGYCACRPASCASTGRSVITTNSWRCTAISIRPLRPRIWTSSVGRNPVHAMFSRERAVDSGWEGAWRELQCTISCGPSTASRLMELQPGQVNWGRSTRGRSRGVRMWIWGVRAGARLVALTATGNRHRSEQYHRVGGEPDA